MWFLALLLAPTADALTHPRSGPSFELVVGGQLGLPPVTGAVSGYGSVGWWDGTYDDSYAIGRYWSANLGSRVDWAPGADLRVSPSFEIRRGLDLVVVGWYFGVGGGPLMSLGPDGVAIGGSGRLAFGGEFRRTRFWGALLRIEAGPDFLGDQVGAAGALMLGFQFSRPTDGHGIK